MLSNYEQMYGKIVVSGVIQTEYAYHPVIKCETAGSAQPEALGVNQIMNVIQDIEYATHQILGNYKYIKNVDNY